MGGFIVGPTQIEQFRQFLSMYVDLIAFFKGGNLKKSFLEYRQNAFIFNVSISKEIFSLSTSVRTYITGNTKLILNIRVIECTFTIPSLWTVKALFYCSTVQ